MDYQRIDAKLASNSVQNTSYICRQLCIWLAGCLLVFAKTKECKIFGSYLSSCLLSLDAGPVLDLLNEEAYSTWTRVEHLPSTFEKGMSYVAFEVMNLISRNLLPLLFVVLNAPSICEGRRSKAGVSAAFSFSAFTRHFESIIFRMPSAGPHARKTNWMEKSGEVGLGIHLITSTHSQLYSVSNYNSGRPDRSHQGKYFGIMGQYTLCYRWTLPVCQAL